MSTQILLQGVPPSSEIELGAFHFEADKGEGGATLRADFSLHVALLPIGVAVWDLGPGGAERRLGEGGVPKLSWKYLCVTPR